jgi:hypothetical protein
MSESGLSAMRTQYPVCRKRTWLGDLGEHALPHSGSGVNSASPGTGSKRPDFQSAFAASIRSRRDETKFHQMWRGPSIAAPPRMASRMGVTAVTVRRSPAKIIERFNAYTRIRNEFNHCIYTVDPQGVITHTQSIRIAEVRGQLQLGSVKPMDQIRIKEIMATVQQLKELNREIWVSCLFLRLTCARSNARLTRTSRSRPRRAVVRGEGRASL